MQLVTHSLYLCNKHPTLHHEENAKFIIENHP
ncbi:Uncharacterised protein [Yersinia intermedia]|nr:Uncharacterised protein [Yersinia intermedia]